MFDFQEDYLSGIGFRKELTDKTPREITMVIDKIYQMVKNDYELEKLDKFYKEKKIKFEFGSETWEKGCVAEDYILQEVIVTWGDWTNAKIKLDCFGIKVFIKKEHENETPVWKISWTQFKKLNELFVTKE